VLKNYTALMTAWSATISCDRIAN